MARIKMKVGKAFGSKFFGINIVKIKSALVYI